MQLISHTITNVYVFGLCDSLFISLIPFPPVTEHFTHTTLCVSFLMPVYYVRLQNQYQ